MWKVSETGDDFIFAKLGGGVALIQFIVATTLYNTIK